MAFELRMMSGSFVLKSCLSSQVNDYRKHEVHESNDSCKMATEKCKNNGRTIFDERDNTVAPTIADASVACMVLLVTTSRGNHGIYKPQLSSRPSSLSTITIEP